MTISNRDLYRTLGAFITISNQTLILGDMPNTGQPLSKTMTSIQITSIIQFGPE